MKNTLRTLVLVGSLTATGCPGGASETQGLGNITPDEQKAAEHALSVHREPSGYSCRTLRTPLPEDIKRELQTRFRGKVRVVICCRPKMDSSDKCGADIYIDKDGKVVHEVWC